MSMLLRVPREVLKYEYAYVEVEADTLDEAIEALRIGLYNTIDTSTQEELEETVYYDEAEIVDEIGD